MNPSVEASAERAASRPSGPALAAFWAVILLISLLQIEVRGYAVGQGNHAVQIPIMKSYFDASLYPDDILIETRDRYTTFYFMALGAAVEAVGHLELLFFVLHGLAGMASFAALYRLGNVLHPRSGWVLVALAFPGLLMMGGARLDAPIHMHSEAAQPLLIWAMALFLEGRRTIAYALCGLAFNLHALSAAHLIVMLGVCSAMSLQSTGLRRVAQQWGVLLVCALPCLVWMASSWDFAESASWVHELRRRSAYHSFPLSWEATEYAQYFALLVAGFFAWSRSRMRFPNREIERDVGRMALCALAMCGAALAFAEWIPLESVLRAQLFRSTKWLSVLLYGYLAAEICVAASKSVGGRIFATALGCVLLLGSRPDAVPLVLAPLLFLLFPWRKPHWGMALLALAVVAATAVAPTEFRMHGVVAYATKFAGEGRGWALCAMIAISIAVAKHRSTIAPVAVRILLAVAALALVAPRLYAAEHPPAEERTGWYRLQQWVQGNTPRDALFLTPPYRKGFRVYSDRSVFVEWKDGTQQYFDKSFSSEWMRRVRKVGMRDPERYAALTQAEIVALQEKYGITHAVFPKEVELPFEVLIKRGSFRLYRLPVGSVE